MIIENLVRKEEVPSIIFTLTRFLFDSVCYHYYLLNKRIHKKIQLMGSSLFISAENSEIRKYSVVRFPWSKTAEKPLFVGIPPHVLSMLVPEVMKWKINLKITEIVDGI